MHITAVESGCFTVRASPDFASIPSRDSRLPTASLWNRQLIGFSELYPSSLLARTPAGFQSRQLRQMLSKFNDHRSVKPLPLEMPHVLSKGTIDTAISPLHEQSIGFQVIKESVWGFVFNFPSPQEGKSEILNGKSTQGGCGTAVGERCERMKPPPSNSSW